MQARMNYGKASPLAMRAMSALEDALKQCGIEDTLQDLVKLRASQINGCAYCVDMHALDLLARGESEQRVNSLVVWEDSPFYTERERAALLWTEKVTLISVDRVPDAVYEEVRRHFTDQELVNLTLVINTINAWNRFSISFRGQAGEYRPR